MATLMVLKFDQPDEAEKALETLKPMQKQELIRMRDAAVVSWPAGRKGPITRQHGPSTVGAGALGGGFWGLLLGLIFFVPLLGAAVGAGHSVARIGGALAATVFPPPGLMYKPQSAPVYLQPQLDELAS